jgi:hypothetical protein
VRQDRPSLGRLSAPLATFLVLAMGIAVAGRLYYVQEKDYLRDEIQRQLTRT